MIRDYDEILEQQVEDRQGRNFRTYGVAAECIANKLTGLNIPAYPWFKTPRRGRNSASAGEVNQFGVKSVGCQDRFQCKDL